MHVLLSNRPRCIQIHLAAFKLPSLHYTHLIWFNSSSLAFACRCYVRTMVVVLGWITLVLIFIVLGLVTLVTVVAVLGHTHPVVVLYGSLIGYMCRRWAIRFVDGVGFADGHRWMLHVIDRYRTCLGVVESASSSWILVCHHGIHLVVMESASLLSNLLRCCPICFCLPALPSSNLLCCRRTHVAVVEPGWGLEAVPLFVMVVWHSVQDWSVGWKL